MSQIVSNYASQIVSSAHYIISDMYVGQSGMQDVPSSDSSAPESEDSDGEGTSKSEGGG